MTVAVTPRDAINWLVVQSLNIIISYLHLIHLLSVLKATKLETQKGFRLLKWK